MAARWSVPALALLLIALPFPAEGQEAAPLLTDPAGDVRLGDQPTPPGAFAGVDMRSLAVTETDDAFRFIVTMEAMPPPSEVRDSGRGAIIEFTHNGRIFQLLIGHVNTGAGELRPAYLRFRDTEDGAWNDLWWRDPYTQVDAQSRTIFADVPRGDLSDALGAAPYRGRSLTSIHASSIELAGFFSEFCCIFGIGATVPARVHDEMPDGATGEYQVAIGPEQSGTARLFSPEPYRASNGEATTFLFKAIGQNVGDKADRFTLRASGVPAGWRVNLPVPALILEPGAQAEVPVALTVPFAHDHGTVKSFLVEMTGQSDPNNVGRARFGVRYLAIPQPAGHHDTVWFHSHGWGEFSDRFDPVLGPGGYVSMNALEQDAADQGKPIAPMTINTRTDATPPYDEYSWCIRLNPTLQIGLDFDLARVGTIRVPLRTTGPLQQAVLSGQISLQPATSSLHDEWSCYRRASNLVPLAELNGTAVDVGAGTEAVLTAEVQPLPGADIVPHARGQDLLLLLQVRAVTVPNALGWGAQAPWLQPGGVMQLPLLEYHDPVTASLSTASGPQLLALGPQERKANVGDTVLFEVSAANAGDAARTIMLNITGVNESWASPPAPLVVPAHATATAQIVVRIPADAADGEAADLLLEAREAASGAASLLRLRVVADGSQDWPDDLAKLATVEEKSSPAASLLALVVVLGAAMLLRRR